MHLDIESAGAMSNATAIRDAIFARLTAGEHPYQTTAKVPLPQRQTDRLPALAVMVSHGTATADGDDNAGAPSFIDSDTIAISIARGFDDPQTLEGHLDRALDAILQGLLTDPTFVRFVGSCAKASGNGQAWTAGQLLYLDSATGRATASADGNVPFGYAERDVSAGATAANVRPLFEAVTAIDRKWVFPRDGETYFAELQLLITFRSRSDYPPVVTDDFETMHIETVFPVGGDAASTQQVIAEFDLPQT